MVTVDGAGQTGSTLRIKRGADDPILKRLDEFCIEDVTLVNPISMLDTGFLAAFVITDEPTGEILNIWPPIIMDGQSQTVTSSPKDGAELVFRGGFIRRGQA